MARLRRVFAPKLPHHVTQRGNRKADVYRDRQDQEVYLRLLLERSRQHSFDILCYCLMTNHIHLVMVPHQEDSLSKGLRDTHGLYATYFNRKYGLTGHLWQGRFYSCLLDNPHLWTAVRYVERNPVRAGMVQKAEWYPWSSASSHCGLREDPILSKLRPPRGLFTDWSAWLATTDGGADLVSIRNKTRTGRPWGSEAFIEQMEARLGRPLKPQKAGRPVSKGVPRK